MAVYKVLQDIEAEDKLLGPLTLKQFIYAAIALAIGVVGYFLIRVNVILVILPLPFFAFFAFMAVPLGREQSNDVWLAARIRFLVKPRRRIWNQNGMTELVTVTAPRKQEIQRVNNLNAHEVRSRLKALASTLDSRGWAVKNVSVNMYTQPSYFTDQTSSDRLVSISNIPQEVPNTEVSAADDIMDAKNNSVAARFDDAIKQKQQRHIADLKSSVAAPVQTQNPAPYTQPAPKIAEPRMTQNGIVGYATFGSQIVAPGTSTVSQPTASNSQEITESFGNCLLPKTNTKNRFCRCVFFNHF